MKIGIGLPAAVPGADMTQLGRYAATAERTGSEGAATRKKMRADGAIVRSAALAEGDGTTGVLEDRRVGRG